MLPAVPPRSQRTVTQMLHREPAHPAICELVVFRRPVLHSQGVVWTFLPTLQHSGAARDAFDAISYDEYSSGRTFTLADNDEYGGPTRQVQDSGEVYSGPRGKLVVINKRR